MELWHGSVQIIRKPSIEACRPHNDYGRGFYCTRHEELAKEWACQQAGRDGFANCYELDAAGLAWLNLNSADFSLLDWLAVLLAHRSFQANTPVAQEGAAYLLEHFGVEVSGYDVVCGYRADDSYFSFARAFLNNQISVGQLARAMKLGDLGEQVVLVSPHAFDRLEFVRAARAESIAYYPLRQARDQRARADYRGIAQSFDRTGLYLRDIVVEGVERDDERLFLCR